MLREEERSLPAESVIVRGQIASTALGRLVIDTRRLDETARAIWFAASDKVGLRCACKSNRYTRERIASSPRNKPARLRSNCEIICSGNHHATQQRLGSLSWLRGPSQGDLLFVVMADGDGFSGW